MYAILGLVGVLVVVLTALSVSNRQLGNGNRKISQQNSDLNKQNAQLIQQISDCTTPGGECYERGSKRSSEAITLLVQGLIFVETCSKTHDTDVEIQSCVTKKAAVAAAAQAAANPTPTPTPTPSTVG